MFDDIAYLHLTEFTNDGSLVFTPRHTRITVYGASGNYVSGSWLYKTEFALKQGRAVERDDFAAQAQNGEELQSYARKDVLQGMIGLEYSGFSDVFITFELAGDVVQDHEDYLARDETTKSLTLLVNREALRNTLRTDLMWVYYFDNQESLFKIVIEYDVWDTLTVNVGIVGYASSEEEGFLYPYRKNDRIMAGIKYSF